MTNNIINLNRGKTTKPEEKEVAIDILEQAIENIKKDKINIKQFILITTYDDAIDKIQPTESIDVFHSDIKTKEILGTIELGKMFILKNIER